MNDKDIEKLKSDSGTFARIRSEWYWQRTHVNNNVEKEMYYLTSCIMCSWCCFFGLCQKCWNLYVRLGFSHFTGRYFSTFCSYNNIESLFIFFPCFSRWSLVYTMRIWLCVSVACERSTVVVYVMTHQLWIWSYSSRLIEMFIIKS